MSDPASLSPRSSSSNGVASSREASSPDAPSEKSLLTQKAYAEEVGVSSARISQATHGEEAVQDEYYPARDAVFDDEGDLIGYEEPTPRPDLNGNPRGSDGTSGSPEPDQGSPQQSGSGGATQRNPQRRQSARNRSAKGQSPQRQASRSQSSQSSRRQNPASRQGMRGGQQRTPPAQSQRQSTPQARGNAQLQGRGQPAQEGQDPDLWEAATQLLFGNPALLYPLLRIGGTAGGAVLMAEMTEKSPGAFAVGGAAGLALAEYCIQAPTLAESRAPATTQLRLLPQQSTTGQPIGRLERLRLRDE